MQDRFRFRVWNKTEKKMIYNAEFAYDGMNYNSDNLLGNNVNNGHICCLAEYLEDDNYNIMQCTGLKDKTGKLIFEGDIVKCNEFVYRVEYDNIRFASFVLIRTNKLDIFKHYFGEAVESEDVEIIGNIYESPELLQKEGE